MARITINGITFDPIAGEPMPSSSQTSDASTSDYILIQTNPSLNDDRRAELANLGVTILEYVPQYSYICHYMERDLQLIRALPFIAWAAAYPVGFKLGPALLSSESTSGSGNPGLAMLAAKPESTFTLESKEVDIVFHDNVDPENLRPEIAAAAKVAPDNLNLGSHKARLTIKPEYLTGVAAVDEVRHIEEVRPPELLNEVARGILRIGALNGGTQFEGEGQIVVVADSGFDIGDKDKVHPAFLDDNVEEPKSRVLKLYDLGRPGNADDPIGHGTHVAGSVLGDGVSADGTFKIRGTAPKARLIVQALHGSQGFRTGLPADLRNLFEPPYDDDGARIHNNSWGSKPGEGVYDQQSHEVDDFVSKHRDFVICFAAGNEGSDSLGTGQVRTQSITSPGTAKNCITVGATESDRPGFFETYGDISDNFSDPIASERMADDPESVAAISSRGPTKDKRIKPDVVAPGTFILSARSRHLDPFDEGSVTAWRPGGGTRFFFFGGTSMASPLVAGCVALVREFLEKVNHINKPSAALVKALLINGARPLTRQTVAAQFAGIPNSEEGFGRVDMAATVGPFAENESITFTDEDDPKEELTKITIAPPTSLLKVTLVWTDPPGEHLQNDLDLIVKAANGEERHGNMAPTSSDYDRANNVEQVVWNGVPAGDVEIIVHTARITPPSLSQRYALVIRTA